jgi:integrase
MVLGLKGVAQTVAQKESSEVQYIELRGRVYWFRRRAPEPIKPGMQCDLDGLNVKVGKNGYIRFSLDTTDKREAGKKARKFAHLLDEVSDRLVKAKQKPETKAHNPPQENKLSLTAAEIQYAADYMYAVLLDADERVEGECVEAAFDGDLEGMREADRHSWSIDQLPPNTPVGQVQLIRSLMPTLNFYLYQYCGKVAEAPNATLVPFANAFRRFVHDLSSRKKGIEVPTPEQASPSMKFSDLYERFRLHKTNNKTWKEPETSDKRDYRPVVREFIKVVGDVDITKLSKADSVKYYEHTMQRSEIMIGTKSRNFDRIKAILRFGEKYYDMSNIKGPLEVESSYSKIHQSYKRFTAAELKLLFHSETYKTNDFDKPSEFWLPMLGLYTGARIAELAGLELDNISTIGGIPCYFLSHPESSNAGGKNNFAPRWVPIHPALIRAGFLQYAELVKSEKHMRLFPCIGSAARDGYGKRATVDFIDYRRELGIGTDKGAGQSTKVFHSFRSTLISELVERRVDGDSRRALVGHASNEVFALKEKNDVHDVIYDQSSIDFKRLYKALAKADFGLAHPVFADTPKMNKARCRKSRLMESAPVASPQKQ